MIGECNEKNHTKCIVLSTVCFHEKKRFILVCVRKITSVFFNTDCTLFSKKNPFIGTISSIDHSIPFPLLLSWINKRNLFHGSFDFRNEKQGPQLNWIDFCYSSPTRYYHHHLHLQNNVKVRAGFSVISFKIHQHVHHLFFFDNFFIFR